MLLKRLCIKGEGTALWYVRIGCYKVILLSQFIVWILNSGL